MSRAGESCQVSGRAVGLWGSEGCVAVGLSGCRVVGLYGLFGCGAVRGTWPWGCVEF